MTSIYKTEHAKKKILTLYDEKLKSLNINYENIDLNTQFGQTRIIKTGNPNGKTIVMFHGINAGAPVTLESIKELNGTYQIYAIDTIGQATKSAETVLDIKGDSYAIWANEVLEKLNITKANFIGISYGAFILQKLIVYKPNRIEKVIFAIPSGLVNGNIWDSITKLTIPMIIFNITKKDKHLKKFIDAFAPLGDEFMFRFLKEMMLGLKLDTRIPPLLKEEDINNFDKPVFIITASNDIFFPSDKIKARSKSLFTNLQEIHTLEGSNHMPSSAYFHEIREKIKEWIN